MTNRFAVLLLVLLPLAAAAQTSSQTPSQAPSIPIPTLQANSQLVVVDVVVQDKDGKPVHGLKPENFQVTESKAPQRIRNFEEHTALPPNARGPELPRMPPGTFTDYTPVPPSGALNILLLDALNTPMKDQSYVRYQLQQYVKKANPGTRIAIFGLGTRLIFLQGFTSDPSTLKDVIDHKLIPRGSTLLDDPVSGDPVDQPSDSIDTSAPGMAELAANLTQFEAEVASTQTQFRVQYTLDALNTLGHYLAAFPGRKNLIWFSGSFPIDILPDGSLNDPFAVTQLNEEEFRETTNLLSKAQVAVYPIDARGLMTQPMFNASNSGRAYAGNPQKFGAALQKFSASQAAEHTTMEQMATDTGGRAFYNTNDLATAVGKAIDAGSNYYTLTYAPTDNRSDGRYRQIRIALADVPGAGNVQLTYRHGYYADTPPHKGLETSTSATTTPAATAQQHSDAAYAQAAMSRGAPTPQSLLFKVRILPASTATEPAVAPGNVLDPNNPAKGPFRRFDVDYVALPSEITLAQQADGRRTGSIEFLINVYDADGRLLNVDDRSFALTLTPETYAKFLHTAIDCHMEVSVPTRTEAYLRIGLRDVTTNRFGVVEIPASSVSHLPPPVYPTAPSKPATTPSTSQPTPTAPSTSSPTTPSPQR
jgi:VWFA-related protein